MADADLVVSGTLNGNAQEVDITLDGVASLLVEIVVTGADTSTATFQGTVDGLNWFNMPAISRAGTTSVSSASALVVSEYAAVSGLYFISVPSLQTFRVFSGSSWGAASFAVTIKAGLHAPLSMIPTPVGFTPLAATNLTSASVNINTTGIQTLVTHTAGQLLRIYRVMLTIFPADDILFYDGAVALTGTMKKVKTVTLDYTGEPWFETSTNNDFKTFITTSGVQMSGRIWYKSMVA